MPRDKQLIKDMSVFATYVNEFQQEKTVKSDGSANSTLVRSDLAPKVSGGYCVGACLDWLRRSVARADESPTASSDKAPKPPQVMGRNGNGAPVGHDKQGRIDRMAMLQVEIDSARNRLKTNLSDPYDAAKKAVSELEKVPSAELGAEKKAELESARAELQRLTPQYQNILGKHLLHQAWPEVEKVIGGVKSENGHGFNKVGVAASKGTGSFDKSEDLVEEVLSLKGLQPGSGAILGLKLQKKGTTEAMTGHAVAIYRNSEDSFFLFDPNLGVFSAATKENLMGATLLLMRHGYNDEGKELSNKGSWALLQPAKAQPKPDAGEVDAAAKIRNSTVKDKFRESMDKLDKDRLVAAERKLHAAKDKWKDYQEALNKDKDLAALTSREKELVGMKEKFMAGNGGELPEDKKALMSKAFDTLKESRQKVESRLDPKVAQSQWESAKAECASAVDEAYMGDSEAAKIFPEYSTAVSSGESGNLFV